MKRTASAVLLSMVMFSSLFHVSGGKVSAAGNGPEVSCVTGSKAEAFAVTGSEDGDCAPNQVMVQSV